MTCLSWPDLLPSNDDSDNNFSQNWDWDNDKSGQIYDWDCLTMHIFHPLPQFFVYLSLKLFSVPPRWQMG
jgi:hypothetical protein